MGQGMDIVKKCENWYTRYSDDLRAKRNEEVAYGKG